MAMKLIPYYCEECAQEVPHPDCGSIPIYSDCPHCSTKRVCLWKDKDKLLAYLDGRRMALNRALCSLLGIRYEWVMEIGGMHIAMREHSRP